MSRISNYRLVTLSSNTDNTSYQDLVGSDIADINSLNPYNDTNDTNIIDYTALNTLVNKATVEDVNLENKLDDYGWFNQYGGISDPLSDTRLVYVYKNSSNETKYFKIEEDNSLYSKSAEFDNITNVSLYSESGPNILVMLNFGYSVAADYDNFVNQLDHTITIKESKTKKGNEFKKLLNLKLAQTGTTTFKMSKEEAATILSDIKPIDMSDKITED